MALEAAANWISDSVMAPTPLDVIRTLTSEVEICSMASRIASVVHRISRSSSYRLRASGVRVCLSVQASLAILIPLVP